MGRGLSELQRTILVMAFHHRQHFDDDENERLQTEYMGTSRHAPPDDLHTHEVMTAHFGCIPSDKRCEKQCRSGRLMRRFGGQYISITKTGATRYRAASVSVNRAFARLEQRGLGERHWHSVFTLTDAGITAARSLTVSTTEKCPKCQPLVPPMSDNG